MSLLLPQLLPRRNAHRRPPSRTWTALGIERLALAVRSLWRGLAASRAPRGAEPRLQVVEKIQLGEKQFIALLELDGQSFLASGAPGAPLQIAAPPAAAGPRTAKPAAPAEPAQAEGAPTPEAAFELSEQEALPLPVQAAEPDAQPLPSRRRGRPRRMSVAAPAPARPGAHNAAPPLFPEALVALPQADPAPAAESQNDAEAAGPALNGMPLPPDGLPTIASKAGGGPAAEPAAEPAVQARPSLAQAVAQARAEEPARKPRRAPAPKKPAAGRPKTEEIPAARAKAEDHLPSPAIPALPQPPALLAAVPPGGPALRASMQPEAHAAAQQTLPALLSQEAPPEEADPKLDPTFAALLHIRMLASEVFGEIDAQPAPPPPPQQKPSGLLRRFSISACLLVALLIPHASAHAAVLAAAAPAGGDIHITGLGGSSAPWSIVVVLTFLTLLPSLLFCITPFARLLIVFHFLRQALGLQTTPSNQTLIGLSLILTFFLMQPTGEVIYRDAILPVQAGKLTPLDGVIRAGEPMRHFMAHYVREKDAQLFLEIAHEPRPRTVEDMSFRVLLPAYILSELKAGFQIGTVLFLPFLIVDMVIASITTSVGMMQLPPVVISTPLKLLLFLMVDGWHLLIGSLMRSFN